MQIELAFRGEVLCDYCVELEHYSAPRYKLRNQVDVAEQRSFYGLMEASAQVLALGSPRLWKWALPGQTFDEDDEASHAGPSASVQEYEWPLYKRKKHFSNRIVTHSITFKTTGCHAFPSWSPRLVTVAVKIL